MIEISPLLHQLTQHPTIHLYARCFGDREPGRQRPRTPHRHPYYLLQYIAMGQIQHGVDLQPIVVSAGEVCLMRPHQVHTPAEYPLAGSWQLIFDEACLSRLPHSFPFLRDPGRQPVFTLSPGTQARAHNLIEAILVSTAEARHRPLATSLLLAYLHALLSELDYAYFQTQPALPVDDKRGQFKQFQQVVDQLLYQQPNILQLSQTLGISSQVLNRLVHHYAGCSPKQYMQQQLVLEAQRHLLYEPSRSVKEIAYSLGFGDAPYFSRFFRQQTGKSVTEFVQESRHLSITKENSSNPSMERSPDL